jgi:APA family basic amino acid/polyamine antiporter
MSRKIGFWSVFALVTGSQIGSGVFMLPANLAPFGILSLLGWVISGFGAIALALVFASLCAHFPKTGGPHAYVKEAFGTSASFFTGWTYWTISWVSTTAVIVATVGYLTPIIGQHSSNVYLALEMLLLIAITGLNLKGVAIAGRAEFILTFLKFIPLLILPVVAMFYFDMSSFMIEESVKNSSTTHSLAQVTLLTLWGFIGLESATTPAGSVENPSKTIPRAIVFGTTCVAFLYFINSVGIMGLIPGDVLMHSKAPYVDATQCIFSGHWHLGVSVIAAVVCIGTLNAWVLSSGQIALGLAEDKLIPSVFAKKNGNGAPLWALLASSIGIFPLLILTANDSLAGQISSIIDFSVVAFLFVYLICGFSFFKLMIQKNELSYFSLFYGLIACGFCCWIIYETPLKTLLVAGLFTASGLPIYLWRKYRKTLFSQI